MLPAMYTMDEMLMGANIIRMRMEEDFHITGPLWGQSTGHWWIPLTKGQWCGGITGPLWGESTSDGSSHIGPVIWSFDVFFFLSLNKLLIKQPSCWLWAGVGGFSKVVATFNHVVGSFNLFMAATGDVWITSSFRIWDYVLHVEHLSCVITNCGQHQWVIPSPLNSSLGLTGGKHYQKITIPILDLFLKIYHSRVPSLYSFLLLSFLLTFSGWFVIVVCGSISVREVVKY